MRDETVRIAALVALGAVAAVLSAVGAGGLPGAARADDEAARPVRPPAVVTSHVATVERWQSRIEVTGSLRAERQVDLAPEVPGTVTEVRFESGQEVAAGAPLVELDARVDRAEVKRLEAELSLARTTLQREERLASRDATSVAVVDAARANVAATEAALASRRAVVDKKLLRAPFAGQLGIRHVDPGEYVAPGAELVTLQDVDTLFVDFGVPQRHLPSLERGAAVRVRVDAYPDEDFEGAVEAIEPRASASTRSFPVRARLPNPDRRLKPGMFARVTLVTGAERDAVTIPQTAVSFNPFGDYVFRIDGELDGERPPTAKQVYVRTGARRGDQVEILDGIAAGERVVTTGQIKVMDGAPLAIDDSIRPDNDPDPRPPSGGA